MTFSHMDPNSTTSSSGEISDAGDSAVYLCMTISTPADEPFLSQKLVWVNSIEAVRRF